MFWKKLHKRNLQMLSLIIIWWCLDWQLIFFFFLILLSCWRQFWTLVHICWHQCLVKLLPNQKKIPLQWHSIQTSIFLPFWTTFLFDIPNHVYGINAALSVNPLNSFTHAMLMFYGMWTSGASSRGGCSSGLLSLLHHGSFAATV